MRPVGKKTPVEESNMSMNDSGGPREFDLVINTLPLGSSVAVTAKTPLISFAAVKVPVSGS
jgi:hypothetical protein